jgi:hypothetical protein
VSVFTRESPYFVQWICFFACSVITSAAEPEMKEFMNRRNARELDIRRRSYEELIGALFKRALRLENCVSRHARSDATSCRRAWT